MPEDGVGHSGTAALILGLWSIGVLVYIVVAFWPPSPVMAAAMVAWFVLGPLVAELLYRYVYGGRSLMAGIQAGRINIRLRRGGRND